MAEQPGHPLTVMWVLFGFRGRIGRKSFWLGALLMLLIQAAVIAEIASYPEDDPMLAMWGLGLLVLWFASAWAILALAVKRLHDLSLPGYVVLASLFPPLAAIGFVMIAFLPSKPEANRYGPPPFPNQ